MEVQKDFLELLQFLNERSVSYLVVGGYAVAFHGSPRYTADIDLFAGPQQENVSRLLEALAAFGFPVSGLDADEILVHRSILQLGRPPVQVRVMVAVTGLSWDEAWASRVPGKYGGCPVYFVGREALIQNKRATGRTKDLADAESLEQA
jgi:hypothetical protein